jgi:hypothetical protein
LAQHSSLKQGSLCMLYNRLLPVLILTIFTTICSTRLAAQAGRLVQVTLPNQSLYATQLLRGDADTYGLGDWRAEVKVALEGTNIRVTGQISFTENANDFTTIAGSFSQLIPVAELDACQHCNFTLLNSKGAVRGINIGARGAQWHEGTGIIQRASITTDTFGDDVGRVGGTIRFAPLAVRVHCPIAK